MQTTHENYDEKEPEMKETMRRGQLRTQKLKLGNSEIDSERRVSDREKEEREAFLVDSSECAS